MRTSWRTPPRISPSTGNRHVVHQLVRSAVRPEGEELLKSRDGWWVAYHGDERIGFASSQRKLHQECLRRGLTDDQFLVCGIFPGAADDTAELLTPW